METNPDLVYVNGIDPETGQYAIPPVPVEDLAKVARGRPGVEAISNTRGTSIESFGVPFGVDLDNLDESGWGVVFHEDIRQDDRAALTPLIEARERQARHTLQRTEF